MIKGFSWRWRLAVAVLAFGLLAVAGVVTDASARSAADRSVVDDTGRRVQLGAPARRVVALSPALVESVFLLGAGDRLVGVVAHSDWPPAARSIPRVGDALALGVEAVLARQPDLVLAWEGGNLAPAVDRLSDLGIPVYRSRVASLDGIGATLERLSVLLGVDADTSLRDFRARLAALPAAPADGVADGVPGTPDTGSRRPVRVFYQVWDSPPMTVNRRHVISDVITRCGGINVFGDAPVIAPTVGVEAVVAAAPDLMIASSPRPDDPVGDPFAGWRRFPAIPAIGAGRLLVVDADRVSRPTPRMLDVAEQICAAIAAARR